mmetsp:Transcript_11328/g.20829  ORF Transcript_11328/g.20829 Transcript_11328/m.20829 type:complete len:247 (+) Transcript_11328:696-1436(+)
MDGTHSHGGMGTEHVILFGMVVFDSLQCVGGVGLGRFKVGLGLIELLPTDGKLAGGFKGSHPCCQRGGILSSQVVKVPFKVGANTNIHGRRNGLLNIIPMIFPLRKEPMKDIILIRSHNQIPHGQSHPPGIIPRQNITKVSSGDGKVHLLHILLQIGNAQITPKVIGSLRQHPAPIDTVHSTKLDMIPKFLISKTRLDNILTIVKRPIHRHAMNVIIRHRSHLPFLNFTHATSGVEDDAIHSLLAA